jgi:hypothetical protein
MKSTFDEIVSSVANEMSTVENLWDAFECTTTMKDEGSNQWRQMEWIGFYFEHVCQSKLAGILDIPGPRYGNVGFDAFGSVPWDFKSHVSGKSKHTLIVNDSIAIHDAVAEYGFISLLIVQGGAEMDTDGKFVQWHNELKGKKSSYVKSRENRGAPSRARKILFMPEEILICRIDEKTLQSAGQFQKNMRNSDGTRRNVKVTLDMRTLDTEIACRIKL